MSAPTPRSMQVSGLLNSWETALLILGLIAVVAFYPPVSELPAVWRAGMREAPWAVGIDAASVLLLIGATIRCATAVARRRARPPLAAVVVCGILTIAYLLLMPLVMQGLEAPASGSFIPSPGLIRAALDDGAREAARWETFVLALLAGVCAVTCFGVSFRKPVAN